MSTYHNMSQFGFDVDTYGRRVYGQPGFSGCMDNAQLRYTNCPGCGEEFGTYYPTQMYHDDRCRAKFRRAQKRLARRTVAPEHMLSTPIPPTIPRPRPTLAQNKDTEDAALDQEIAKRHDTFLDILQNQFGYTPTERERGVTPVPDDGSVEEEK